MTKPTYEELERRIRELESQKKTSYQKGDELRQQADIVLAESEAKYKTLLRRWLRGHFIRAPMVY